MTATNTHDSRALRTGKGHDMIDRSFTTFLRNLDEKPNEILEGFVSNLLDAPAWWRESDDDADTAWWNDDAEYSY